MAKLAVNGIDAAAAYAEKHTLHALLISSAGKIVVERYENGFGASGAHPLYSGTKSFWGIAALRAVEDGLFELDEPVVDTIPEFKGDIRREITPRMLLTMTAGYGFGGLGSAVPTYEKALSIAVKNRPGSTFTYGGIPLQVFGAFFSRVLQSRNETPHDYLKQRVLVPADVHVDQWRTLSDGTHPLPTGVMLRATSWLAYGRYILQHIKQFGAATEGTKINPRYGLCWWLAPTGVESDVFYASGSAGQALYIVPSRKLVVVHFAKSTTYKHDAFLKRLLAS